MIKIPIKPHATIWNLKIYTYWYNLAEMQSKLRTIDPAYSGSFSVPSLPFYTHWHYYLHEHFHSTWRPTRNSRGLGNAKWHCGTKMTRLYIAIHIIIPAESNSYPFSCATFDFWRQLLHLLIFTQNQCIWQCKKRMGLTYKITLTIPVQRPSSQDNIQDYIARDS